jgi:hypothetical protein
MDFLVSKRLMSVSAAYLAQEYIMTARGQHHRGSSTALLLAMASMLLAIGMVDSQAVCPTVVWQAGIRTGVFEDNDSDPALTLLAHVNLIIEELGCNLWLPTFACPRLASPVPLACPLLAFVLTRALPSFPCQFALISTYKAQIHGVLLHSSPEAHVMPAFSLLLTLLPSRNSIALLRIYTQAVHAHFLRTCEAIMATLRQLQATGPQA